MTDQEIRIAVAEACGWKREWVNKHRHIAQWVVWKPDGVCDYCDPDPNAKWEVHRLPDYPNDLNAMHEAEKVLNSIQLAEFRDHLCDLLINTGLTEDDAREHSVHATARQRAEAFLRTVGKWRE